jgi:hypothetical protein
MSTTAAASWAATKYVFKGDRFTTKVSGTKDEAPSLVGYFAGGYQGLYGLAMWETNDKPCRVKTYSRHLNTLSTKTDNGGSSDYCKRAKKSVKLANTDTFVRGIAVCHSGTGRVKGVRLYGAKLNRKTGKLSNVSGSASFERTNCKTWKTPVYCPVGKVATSLKVHRESLSSRSSIVGYALTCETPIKK